MIADYTGLTEDNTRSPEAKKVCESNKPFRLNNFDKYNPFLNNLEDDLVFDIDNTVNFNSTETKSYQRGIYIKGIQHELFLYSSLMIILSLLSIIHLKKYYFVVPLVFCLVTLYGVYTFNKLILWWLTIISILVNLSLWILILVRASVTLDYMVFMVSIFLLILYTLILFRQLQYYYYIPPHTNTYLGNFYRYIKY